MKVRLETSYVDLENGIDAEYGDEVDLPADVAKTLLERGSATPVTASPAGGRKTRTKTAPEKRG